MLDNILSEILKVPMGIKIVIRIIGIYRRPYMD